MGRRSGRVRQPQSLRYARHRREGSGRRQEDGERRRCRREGRLPRLGECQSRSALRPARQGRHVDHGARRRSRPPAVTRGRQDLPRGQGRSHARGAHLQVHGRRGAASSWRHGRFDASRRRGGNLPRAARRVRSHHAVEFPDRDSGLEERARAGLRQHGGHEARVAHAGDGACADGNHPRSRHSRRACST